MVTQSTITVTRSAITYNASKEGPNIYIKNGSNATCEDAVLYSSGGAGIAGAGVQMGCNTSVEPGFLDSVTCDEEEMDYHLRKDSPLVDAASGKDPDGTDADIGAFGGELADMWDLDGDGYYAWFWTESYTPPPSEGLECYDSDDLDPAVHPEAGSCP